MKIGQQLGPLATTGFDPTWRDDASCRSEDPELFFPEGSPFAPHKEIEAAKAICQACQVQDHCLNFALRTNQEYGIWGGTSEAERRRLRRVWLATRRTQRQLSA